MDITKTLISSVSLYLLVTMNAHAAYPEQCFQSDNDYKVYQKFGDNGSPGFDNSQVTADTSHKEYLWLRQAGTYGPPKKKVIDISVKQTQASSGATIYADASPSVTPSGQAVYRWGNGSTNPQYSASGGNPGSYSNIQLTVSDPVCGVSASTQVRVTSK